MYNDGYKVGYKLGKQDAKKRMPKDRYFKTNGDYYIGMAKGYKDGKSGKSPHLK